MTSWSIHRTRSRMGRWYASSPSRATPLRPRHDGDPRVRRRRARARSAGAAEAASAARRYFLLWLAAADSGSTNGKNFQAGLLFRKASVLIPTAPGPGAGAAGSACNGMTLRKDRKSTRLNSSHSQISYAVFCLKKKKKKRYKCDKQTIM